MACKHKCQFRRALNSGHKENMMCYYFLDTGKLRNCHPDECTHYKDPERAFKKKEISFKKIHDGTFEWVANQYWRK